MPHAAADPLLASKAVVDWQAPAVRTLAAELGGWGTPEDVAARCFHWVRDRIRRGFDADGRHAAEDWPVSCAASEVLASGTGICFAKGHLLAPRLRANGIPAGFGYQRLSLQGDGPPFMLHGFVRLRLPGEHTDPPPHPEPLPVVVALRQALPDGEPAATLEPPR